MRVGQRESSLDRAVVARTELSVVVRPPRVHGAARGESDAVSPSGRERDERFRRRHDLWQWKPSEIARTDPERAPSVTSERVEPPVARERERVLAADGDCGHENALKYPTRTRRARERSVPQLSTRIQPPRVRGTASGVRHRVIEPARHARERFCRSRKENPVVSPATTRFDFSSASYRLNPIPTPESPPCRTSPRS